VVRAERKSAIRAIKNGRQVIIRDDYSGKITGIEAAPLQALLAKGQIPVIAPLALGMEGERLNVDGDLVAAEIAKALGAEHLLLLSNVAGLLRDVNEPASLVSGFRLTEWADYEGLAQGRMKKKLLAAQVAAPSTTILADARLPAPLDAALAGGGTHISPS
jgi:acetylglutamate/LysW-gamma-L-alpha-aminoadipate kinase